MRRVGRPATLWDGFNEPVDRFVSIGAFEHFGFAKYPEFFNKTYDLMPDDGVILPASRAVGSRPPTRGNSPGRAPQFIDGHFAKRQC